MYPVKEYRGTFWLHEQNIYSSVFVSLNMWGEKLGKGKGKGKRERQGIRLVPVLRRKTSVKFAGPKYIGR